MKISAIFLSLIVIAAVPSSAQVPVLGRVGIDDLGTRPFGVYDGTNENINLENNNLNLSIPLVSLPGRNGHNLDLRLTYDSNIYRLSGLNWVPIKNNVYHWVASWNFMIQGLEVGLGWRLNWPILQNDGPTVLYPPGGSGNQYTACIANSTVTLFDGSRHVFRANLGCVAPTSDIVSQIPVMDSEDPDGAQINVQDYPGSTVVTLRDGTKIYFTGTGSLNGTPADKIVDASGNVISQTTGSGGMVITDTVGRQVTFNNGTITYVDVNGTSQTILLSMSSHNVTLPPDTGSAPTVINNQNLIYSETLLDSIVINSGSSQPQTYSLTYNSNGELSQIVYPHQGCTAYDYSPFVRLYLDPPYAAGTGQLYIPVPGVSAKHVSPTGQCSNPSAYYTTTYTPTAGPTEQVNNTEISVQFPDGTTENHYFSDASIGQVESDHGISAQECKVDTLSSAGKLMKEVMTTWTTSGCTTLYSWDLPIAVTTTFYDVNGNAVSTTQKTISYDSLTVTYEPYPLSGTGYAPYQPTPASVSRYLHAPISEKVYDYGAGTQSGPLLTQKTTTYDYDSNSALLHSNARVFGKPTKTVLTGATSSPAFTTKFLYDQSTPAAATASQHQTIASGLPRGNLTELDKCVDDACATILPTLYAYDDFGNLTQLTDPKNNVTKFSWTDSWDTSGGGTMTSCMPSVGSFAYVTTITNAKNQPVTAQYRPCTGARSQLFDLNNQQTSYTFDPLGRILSESLPDGGQTLITYDDVNRIATFKRLRDTQGHQIVTSATYDGIGRLIQHSLTAPEGAETVEYGYDGRDRKISQTNPHLSTSSPTDGTTQYVLDGLSRTTQVIQADGSTVSTDYTQFPSVTVTDEAGKQRKTKVDGAGRLFQVIEDPAGLGFETDYQYDAAGNLTCAEQHGGVTGTGCSSSPSNDATSPWRVRRFTYDDLSRLLTAKNPESGTITYTYDADGNVITKKDARAITTCFGDWSSGTSTCNGVTGYDALNRILKKTYSDGNTPSVQFGYDGTALTGCTIAVPGDPDAYPVGLRTSMCDGSGGASWKHDKMGRILQERRTIGSASGEYDTDAYNLDGSVQSLTALGYALAYIYDVAGRPIKVENPADPFNYVISATYAPTGGLTAASLGATPITISNAYNDRLQPILLSAKTSSATLFSECFDFHLGVAINTAPCSFSAYTSGDNGNVYQVTNNRDNTRTQSFAYDVLNRIKSGQSSGTQWGETFTIDAWGNLTNQSPITGKTNHEGLNTSAGTNNRLSGYGYDAAGNMTSNGTASYVYDAENRLIATAGASYIYDGDGNRVEKCTEGSTPGMCASGATGTLYWRGMADDPLAETDLAGNVVENYIFFGGQRIARRDAATKAVHFYFSDHLGTHGVVENAAGTSCEQDIDYYPYGGEEHDYCPNVAQHHKFNGKERDTESGLDYFGARHHASSLGRFMTPDWAAKPTDVPYANFGNPQSLNLYSYVENNPTTMGDPDGHDCPPCVAVIEDIFAFAGEGAKDGAVLGPEGALAGAGLGLGIGVVANGGGRSPAGYVPGGSLTDENGNSIFQMSKQGNTSTQGTQSAQTGQSTPAEPPEDGGGKDTIRAARREAMRQEGIPTSQQPSSQTSTEAGRQSTYEVPKAGGGTQTKIVTNQLKDENHGPHVEAGAPKANGQTDPSGRLRHANPKTKVNVNQ